MKQLTWKLVLPLTVISFVVFTKWWHVEIDGFGEILSGFPLPFVCSGWHTSLSLQIFVLELVTDVLVYFSFWFFIIMTATKTVKSFRVPKSVTTALVATSGLFTMILILFAINPENIYTTTRPFDIEIKRTGYRFIWQSKVRLDYDKHPDTK